MMRKSVLLVSVAALSVWACVQTSSDSSYFSDSLYQEFGEVLDVRDYIGIIKVDSVEDCPGEHCVDSTTGDGCACPFGVRIGYTEIERIVGVDPPAAFVSGMRDFQAALDLVAMGGPIDGIAVATNIELPSSLAQGQICGVPPETAFMHAELRSSTATEIAALQGDRAYGLGCVANVLQQRSHLPQAEIKSLVDVGCWKPREATLADLRESAERRSTRGSGAVSVAPLIEEPHADRGPYWCLWAEPPPSTSSTSSSGG